MAGYDYTPKAPDLAAAVRIATSPRKAGHRLILPALQY